MQNTPSPSTPARRSTGRPSACAPCARRPDRTRRRFGALPTALAAAMAVAGAAHAQKAAPALQQVVVTATRHALPLLDAPATMTVVPQQAMLDKGADNVIDALAGEPGVAVIGRPLGGRRVLSLRGMESRHTLMLLDGQRLAASDGVIGHSDFQGDWLAAADVERVEVVRGPMSVLYGAEALGGVVNVVTRAPSRTAWGGFARAEGLRADGGRGGDGHRLGARVAGPLADGVALAVTGAQSRRQAVQSDDPRIDELEGRGRLDGGVRLDWAPGAGHTVALTHREGTEDRWLGARERSGARRYHQSLQVNERRHSALSWDAEWQATSFGARDVQTQLRVYGAALANRNTRTNGVAPLKPNEVTEGVVDGLARARFGAQHWTAGFEHREEGLRNAALAGGVGTSRHAAVYLQDEVALSPTLQLTAGVRHDQPQRYAAQTSPRVYVVWQPAPGWVVKGGAGTGFKAPTLKQVTDGYAEAEGPFLYLGNPTLKVERNRAYEVGAGWQSKVAAASLTLFDNRVRDLIVPVLVNASGAQPQYQFRNVDEARLKGAEANAEWRPLPALAVTFQHQWLDARDATTGARLDRRPSRVAAVGASWQQGAWRAGLRVDHQAGLLLTPTSPVGATPQPVPDLTFVSAHAAWRFMPRAQLSLGVDNAGNVRLAEQSSLFVNAVAPRTWRAAVQVDW